MTDLDWHERRRQGIGASEVAAVLGRSDYASPTSVYYRKVGLIPPDADEGGSDAARFGKDLEPITARWFHLRTGLHVAGEQMMLTHPEHPWARCTVDGLVYDGPGAVFHVEQALGVLELKFTGQSPWTELPEHHRLQVQWQLYVSGLERGWLAAFHTGFGRLRFQVYEVERDDELLAEIVPAVEHFWTGHVLAGIPPPTDGADATTDALKAVYGPDSTDDSSVDLDAGTAHAVELLRDAKAQAADLANVVAELENELRGALGPHTEGRVRGFRVVSWKPQQTRRIDAQAVRAAHGDTYDTVTTSRVLRLHKGAR